MRKHLPWSAVLVALALVACQTITEELPAEHTPVTPATVPPAQVPVIVIPVPTVTPPPAAPAPNNPAPQNPAPPANPAPAPAPQSCPLPAGTWNENCHMQAQTFLSRVEAAIDEVVRTEPHIFNFNRTRCPNCYEVRDPTRYVNRVAQVITRNGVCGYYDGEELGVKSSNQFNDQFDILTADLFIRRGEGSYRSTCRPAWF